MRLTPALCRAATAAIGPALLVCAALLALLALPVHAADAPAPPAAAAAPASAAAPSPPAAPAAAPLDERVQDLKGQIIALERDLLVLEEELLYPAGTQVAVFVSMDVGRLFELESVQLQLDDKPVAMHLYTPLEVQALHRGGMQRLFMGNLKSGRHRITAYFTGQGPHERDYRRGATFEFDKGTEPRYIELRIRDLQAKLQPEFETKVWQ